MKQGSITAREISRESVMLLIKHQDFFQALRSGEHEPTTDLQKRFIAVIKGDAPAITPHERAYANWLGISFGGPRRAMQYGEKPEGDYRVLEGVFENGQLGIRLITESLVTGSWPAFDESSEIEANLGSYTEAELSLHLENLYEPSLVNFTPVGPYECFYESGRLWGWGIYPLSGRPIIGAEYLNFEIDDQDSEPPNLEDLIEEFLHIRGDWFGGHGTGFTHERFYESGQLKEREGVRADPYESFYESGQLKQKGYRGHNCERFYESGQLKEKEVYRDGSYERFYESGQLQQRGYSSDSYEPAFQDDPYSYWDEQSYIDGGGAFGFLPRELPYSHSYERFYESGQLEERLLKDGSYECFYESGQLEAILILKEYGGRRRDRDVERKDLFYEGGQLKERVTRDSSKPRLFRRECFDENGELISAESYSPEKLEGIHPSDKWWINPGFDFWPF